MHVLSKNVHKSTTARINDKTCYFNYLKLKKVTSKWGISGKHYEKNYPNKTI